MALVWPMQMSPAQKAVLVSLADNANDSGYCWPSIEKICERTCLGRTAVIQAIKWLEAEKYLQADRSNGRKTTYTLHLNQSARRTGTGNEPVRETDESSTADGLNQYGRRTLTVNNRKEPSIINTAPDGVDDETWAMFVDHRKEKEKPLTKQAYKLLANKLIEFRKQGHDLNALIHHAIENGWTSVFIPGGHDGTRKQSRPESATERMWRSCEGGLATGTGS